MDSRIGLLINGEASFAARIKTLRQAGRSIRIQALLFKNDEAGRAGAEILKAKRRGGVETRVIVGADRYRAIGGSCNLDPRSETLNSETVLEFESDALSAELARRVIENDLPKCNVITRQQALQYHDPNNPANWLKLHLWNGLKGEL